MRTYDCPSCGATVTFQSSVSVFVVCPFCRSMVIRHDLNLAAMGQMAELPPDLSPLQIGTRGRFQNRSFTLIGRLRQSWSDGSWNEWCALFDDNQWGWVAETQGFFLVSFEHAATDLPPLTSLTPGTPVNLAGQSFQVIDVKHTTCIGSEGELPFAAPAGREGTGVDLMSEDGAFAGIEFTSEGTRLFVGRYARFGALGLTELRPVPGWTPGVTDDVQRGSTVTLNCPTCGAPVSLRASGLSMSAICGSCGSILDTSNRNVALIEEVQNRQKFAPEIPLGTRGEFGGVTYELIGFAKRRDTYSVWSEYLLFNPWHGFRWLTSFHGHWNLVGPVLELPRLFEAGALARKVSLGAATYSLYGEADARVVHVMGEFFWKVRLNEMASVADYIRPPRILSRERYPGLNEVTWSEGEYIAPEAVRAAFRLEQPLQASLGTYLNQPNPFTERWRSARRWALLFSGVLLVIQILSAGRTANQRIVREEFIYRKGGTNDVVITAPFELKGGPQAVKVIAHAPVDNQWIELSMDLVHSVTRQKDSLRLEMERYSGWDDGPWEEGRQTVTGMFPGVGDGRYYLAIDPSADDAVTELPYDITLVRDVPIWSNFWILFVGLLIYPGYIGLRHAVFERARWADSDYSPFPSASGGSDDDDSDDD